MVLYRTRYGFIPDKLCFESHTSSCVAKRLEFPLLPFLPLPWPSIDSSPRSKRRWWRCIWRECLCGEWRTSPKRSRGTGVSSETVSRLNQKIYCHIEAWRNRQITGEFPYVYLDGVVLKRTWGGEIRNVSVLIAIGVATDGFRQILGVAEGQKEDLEGWRGFYAT